MVKRGDVVRWLKHTGHGTLLGSFAANFAAAPPVAPAPLVTFETREVLADAYPRRRATAMLTHLVEVRDGRDAGVVCARVRSDSLADAGSLDAGGRCARPTCPPCGRRWDSLRPAPAPPCAGCAKVARHPGEGYSCLHPPVAPAETPPAFEQLVQRVGELSQTCLATATPPVAPPLAEKPGRAVLGSLVSGPFLLVLHGPEGETLPYLDYALLANALLAFVRRPIELPEPTKEPA